MPAVDVRASGIIATNAAKPTVMKGRSATSAAIHAASARHELADAMSGTSRLMNRSRMA